MTSMLFRRATRRWAALAVAAMSFSLLDVTEAPPAAAAISKNCGVITCTLYLDKQSTRALQDAFSNNLANLGESVAIGIACSYIATPAAGVACGAVAALGSFYIKNASQAAVDIDGCLTYRWGLTTPATPGGLGASSNPSYCKAGVPLFPDGQLIKQSSNPYVYVAYGGAKFLIPNPDSFNALGFSWSAIRTISDGEFNRVPRIPAHGTVLRELTLPTVYRIEKGRKRALTLSEFLNMGYNRYLRYVADGQLVQIRNS